MTEVLTNPGVITYVLTNLRKVPEVRAALTWFQNEKRAGNTNVENPITTAGRDYVHSLELFFDLVNLGPDDLAIVNTANQIASEEGLTRSSAAENGLSDFLVKLGAENKDRMLRVVTDASRVDSPYFQEAVVDLAKRMQDGSELNKRGAKPSDKSNDPAAARAIWGHAFGVRPEALGKFIRWHHMSRMFTAIFKDDINPELSAIAATKDGIFGAFEELINLRHAQGLLDEETYNSWTKAKDDGGLGWNKPEMQEIYRFVVAGGKNVGEFRARKQH